LSPLRSSFQFVPYGWMLPSAVSQKIATPFLTARLWLEEAITNDSWFGCQVPLIWHDEFTEIWAADRRASFRVLCSRSSFSSSQPGPSDCRQSDHPALDQRADRHRRGAPQFLDVEAIDRVTKRRFPRRKEALARAFQPDQTTLDRDPLADILKWLQL